MIPLCKKIDNPHATLGLHSFHGKEKVIRLWRPGGEEIFLELAGAIKRLERVDQKGVFELVVPSETMPCDYRIYHNDGLLAHDPYAFDSVFSDSDTQLFAKGTHYNLYQVLGANLKEHQGVLGVHFAVWAPHALTVSLIGDFNHFDGRVNPMRSLGASGVWELFVPGLESGQRYKFEITTGRGELLVKADPFAFASELRPKNASIISDLNQYVWHDAAWLAKRALEKEEPKPLLIYEVHLDSWFSPHAHFLNYKELAPKLSEYCKNMGFTHIELLPLMEHPLDESWGYQVIGYFAVTSRHGSASDFMWFVDHMHQEGIGVILDWVPGHFPTDTFSLSLFDGTPLFEYADPKKGYHEEWQTNVFNYGRPQVSNFLIASALFWLEKMHVDGLRVDAVTSMLYLDYEREEGQWLPNYLGGREHLEAIDFLKHLNKVVHERVPGALTIAEEASSFPGVTDGAGLGFDLKWNMGWMNDTLSYFSKPSNQRAHHHNELTFGLLYAFSEKYLLPFSHDEVVHGKKSLLSKMPGDPWQQRANLRLLYSYMICQPGKKMLFMGAELGQLTEWDCKGEISWHLLQSLEHQQLRHFFKEINYFYLRQKPLWARDVDEQSFEWVHLDDHQNSVIAYRRKGSGKKELLCVHNFIPEAHMRYRLPLAGVTHIQEVFNSDAKKFGGSGQRPEPLFVDEGGLTLSLAPLSAVIFEIAF